MRLSDKDIEKYIQENRLKIEPNIVKNGINGVTVDVRLGNKFRIFNAHEVPYLDLSGTKENLSKTLEIVMGDEIIINDDELFYLHPHQLALAVTYELFSLPNDLVGWLDGRSSLARLGLMVHVTAHRIDPGFEGNIVLEFFNSGCLPLALKPKMIIGALSFELLTSPVLRPYNRRKNAKYKNQKAVLASRIDQD